MFSQGYDGYYNKYINVKKGGIGGVAMLVTGYVVLSYVWNYEHLSKDCIHSVRIELYLIVLSTFWKCKSLKSASHSPIILLAQRFSK